MRICASTTISREIVVNESGVVSSVTARFSLPGCDKSITVNAAVSAKCLLRSRNSVVERRSEKSGAQLLVVNLENPGQASRIISAELIYRTTWGELCHDPLDLDYNRSEAWKYLELASCLYCQGKTRLDDVHFFIATSRGKSNIEEALKESFIRYSNRRGQNGGPKDGRKSRLRLDVD